MAATAAGLQPRQGAHLAAVDELTARRGQVIGNRAGHEAERLQPLHARLTGEIEQNVLRILERVLLEHARASPEDPLRQRIGGAAHVARGIRSGEQVRGALRAGAVGPQAAIDQRLRLLERGGGNRHRRPHLQLREGQSNSRIEVGARLRRLAVLGAEYGVEAERERRGDRHALHAVGYGPGQRVGLDVRQRLLIGPGLDRRELLRRDHGATGRKPHLDNVLEQDPALRRVVLADLHAQGIPGVHDHGELRRVERQDPRRQRRRCACGNANGDADCEFPQPVQRGRP